MAYLGMGQLMQKVERERYTRIVVAVEAGYLVRCFTLRASIDDPKIQVIDELNVGDKVLFTGELREDGNTDTLRFDSIVKSDFVSCSVCGIAMVTNYCVSHHDEEAIKLDGNWKIIHVTKLGHFIKLWFEKSGYIFGAASCSTFWFHPTIRELCEGDFVDLEGWKYKNSTSLKYVRKLNVTLESTI